MKELAVEGLVLKCTIPGGIGTAEVAPSSVPSTKCKAEGKGIYFEKLDVIIKAGSGISGTCISDADYQDVIDTPTIQKVMVEGKPAMSKGDMKTFPSVPGKNPSTGAGCVFSATVEIDDPGQTKCLGN